MPEHHQGTPISIDKHNMKLHRDNNQIRANLLNKLGIHPQCASSPDQIAGIKSGRKRVVPLISRPDVRDARNFYYERIKSAPKKQYCSPRSVLLNYESEEAKRVVRFQTHASVVTIPSLDELSDDTKRSLWRTEEEEEYSMSRNSVEYLAEGRDWRWAVEEHQMYLDRVTGAMVHPVHIVPEETALAYVDNEVVLVYRFVNQSNFNHYFSNEPREVGCGTVKDSKSRRKSDPAPASRRHSLQNYLSKPLIGYRSLTRFFDT